MTTTFIPTADTYRIAPEDLRGLLTPALVLFMDHVDANIRRMLQLVGNRPERWRPHMKTIKTPFVFARLAALGVHVFKCATTREAHVLLSTLAEHGAADADLLVSYPHLGPALIRLGQIARAHPRSKVSVLCEDPVAVDAIPP
jgi:D-serine deaminase-like pyridoxal phosphate-dependent protein